VTTPVSVCGLHNPQTCVIKQNHGAGAVAVGMEARAGVRRVCSHLVKKGQVPVHLQCLCRPWCTGKGLEGTSKGDTGHPRGRRAEGCGMCCLYACVRGMK
jgi:hypothetical protein